MKVTIHPPTHTQTHTHTHTHTHKITAYFHLPCDLESVLLSFPKVGLNLYSLADFVIIVLTTSYMAQFQSFSDTETENANTKVILRQKTPKLSPLITHKKAHSA